MHSLLSAEELNFAEIGVLLHTYADTWSHEGFTAWHTSVANRRTGSWRPNIGHADTHEGGHEPDRPYNDVDKALEAALVIYELIPNRSSGTALSRAAIERDLRRAFSYRQADEGLRIQNFQALIKHRFGDNARYDMSSP